MAEGNEWHHPESPRETPEDPHGRGIEARGNVGIEDTPERENQFWLARFMNPESIERVKRSPAYEEASTEWVICDRLLSISIETGPELPPHIRQRLSNLIGLFRVAMFPNLRPQEQDSLHRLANATTVDMRSLQFEINDEARDDLQWIWATFNLERPEGNPTGLLPAKN